VRFAGLKAIHLSLAVRGLQAAGNQGPPQMLLEQSAAATNAVKQKRLWVQTIRHQLRLRAIYVLGHDWRKGR